MKKALIFSVAIILLSLSGYQSKAQEVLGLPYEKHHTSQRKPLPYQFLREADVMWSKMIWRRIVLKEKENLTLFYPKFPLGTGNDKRMSLIDVLLEGIHNSTLTPFKEIGNDEFATQLKENEVLENLGAKIDTITVETPEGQQVKKANVVQPNSFEVKEYLLKELWFFDKQRSVMEVRIIGIAPIREYFREDDKDEQSPQYKKVCWIYFPEARKLLATKEIFNPKNDALRLSYDDIFQKRMFSSYIFQESNTYGNRLIADYCIGLETLLEAERIKEGIFNFEQDLWEY